MHSDSKKRRSFLARLFTAGDVRRSLKKMKKRLRKKKHLYEFAEWGRQLIAIRNTKMDADTFQDAFIIKAIEGNECYCGGSLSDNKIDVIVELGRISENPGRIRVRSLDLTIYF